MGSSFFLAVITRMSIMVLKLRTVQVTGVIGKIYVKKCTTLKFLPIFLAYFYNTFKYNDKCKIDLKLSNICSEKKTLTMTEFFKKKTYL